MTFKSQASIGDAHALAVVNDLYECLPRSLYKYLYQLCPSIYRVFNQFLHHRRWSLNDFAGSYLVGNGVGQKVNDIRHNAKKVYGLEGSVCSGAVRRTVVRNSVPLFFDRHSMRSLAEVGRM